MRISLGLAFVFYIGMVLIYVLIASLSDPRPEEISLDSLNIAFHVLLGIWFCQERCPVPIKPEANEDEAQKNETQTR